jgi:tryptophan-rich sensory protein
MEWTSLLPEVGIIVAIALVAVGLHFLLQRRTHYETLRKHNDVAGFLFSAIGTIFAVVLGFLVVIVWEKYDAAVANAQIEVAAVSDLYRDVASYPVPQRDRIRRELHAYMDTVAQVEWPAMRRGETPTAAIAVLETVAWNVERFAPSSMQQSNAQSKSMDQVERLLDARRLRIHQNEPSVPPVLWFALIVGASATIGFAFLFGVENRTSQLVMTGILATVIGLLFVVIFEFDSPFSGAVSIPLDGWGALHQRLTQIH